MAARGVNKAILVGNLAAEPDFRMLNGGSNSVATVSLATNESFRDQNGNIQERTEWHRIVFWGRLAEIARDYLHKGSQVYVEGKIRTRSYDDQNGQRKYITEIQVTDLQMLGNKPQNQDNNGYGANNYNQQYGGNSLQNPQRGNQQYNGNGHNNQGNYNNNGFNNNNFGNNGNFNNNYGRSGNNVPQQQNPMPEPSYNQSSSQNGSDNAYPGLPPLPSQGAAQTAPGNLNIEKASDSGAGSNSEFTAKEPDMHSSFNDDPLPF
ncbi:MAG: single-stranded DNA-binding protein [Ruminobacter sp.]|jgi:single-strand DNA-binding protein|uniref:Single-stranded DNA-binding protein n=1 Tax=Ruminobacter amylophilus TaxID=867 RepID=A0A662ZJD1_9GAMM|nr:MULTISPECIES: single-stranded DNA-binding protein [Ruminobacter]MBQ3774676.1 single-stranded DNA-binding protein [Ruminobacter sp.]SFP65277.1 single-strand DNA-binding protein [Ruminobacter amylophilus]